MEKSPQESGLQTYGKAERNLFLIGLTGQNILFNVFNGLFSYFAQFVLAVPAMMVSTIVAAGRVWDAANDPIMGTIIDRTRSKWGKCRPYLLFIPVPLFVIISMSFFSVDVYHAGGVMSEHNLLILIWLSVFCFLYSIAYTVGDIPLWGSPSLMTESDKDRNKLYSLARVFGGVGGGITMLTITPCAQFVSGMLTKSVFNGDDVLGERWGFFAVAVVFTLIGCALFQLTAIKMRERVQPSAEKHSLLGNVKMMWNNKPFRQVLLSGILSSPKNIVLTVAFPLVNYYFAGKNPALSMMYLAILGGGLMIGTFVGQGFVPRLNQRYEKKTLYNYTNLLSVPFYLIALLLYLIVPNHDLTGMGYTILLSVLFFFSGGLNGVNLVMQTLMIGDAVDYEEYHNGIRPDGVFFSGQTFLAKLAGGIATIISGIGYAAVGFSDAKVQQVNDLLAKGLSPQAHMPEYGSYMTALFFLISIPPAIGCLLALIPTWNYVLNDKEHKRILDVLNTKRHAREAGGNTETIT